MYRLSNQDPLKHWLRSAVAAPTVRLGECRSQTYGNDAGRPGIAVAGQMYMCEHAIGYNDTEISGPLLPHE